MRIILLLLWLLMPLGQWLTSADDDIPEPDTYPTVHTEWVALNYSWNSQHTYADYYSSGKYKPENCIVTGISVAKNGVIYVSVPRWRSGVPATLNSIEHNGDRSEENALVPYPDWDIQEEGVEGDLQNTQSMTIDSNNLMWALDVGRRNFFDDDAATVNGPAGVWRIDLTTGDVVDKYYFPDSVVPYNDSFLNDLVLDEGRRYAYFSDAWGDGAIIILDYSTSPWTSRRYSGSSTQNDPDYVMIINGINYGADIFTTPVDGIAISNDGDALFYCAVQNTKLYRLPTSVLRDFDNTDEDIDDAVEYIGPKNPSDGMKWLSGILYYGDLTISTYDSVYIDDTSTPNIDTSSSGSDVYVEDPSVTKMNWIDTFAIDLSREDRMWFTSNRLNLYVNYTMDFSGASGSNFRLMRFDTVDDDDDKSNDDDLLNGELSVGEISAIAICTVFLFLMGGAAIYFKFVRTESSTPPLMQDPSSDAL